MKKQLLLKNRVEEISRLAEFVEQIAEELQISASQSFSINLALEEAATNVINYAFPKDEEHLLQIDAQGEVGKMLTLRIVDSGIPFDPLTQAPEVDITLSAEERPIGGLGIFLVQQIMDEVTYENRDGKNILTMSKQLGQQPA